MHCALKFSGIRYGKRQWNSVEYYFCENLQVQAFAQHTVYVISVTVIKIWKILNILQIKFNFNSIVCVFNNVVTCHLRKHCSIYNLVFLWSPSAPGSEVFPMRKHWECNAKVAAHSRNILLNKMYPSHWKKKKPKASSILSNPHNTCWNESILTLGPKCFFLSEYCHLHHMVTCNICLLFGCVNFRHWKYVILMYSSCLSLGTSCSVNIFKSFYNFLNSHKN